MVGGRRGAVDAQNYVPLCLLPRSNAVSRIKIVLLGCSGRGSTLFFLVSSPLNARDVAMYLSRLFERERLAGSHDLYMRARVG